ncbi:SAM-dependent methyltransferase [Azospirillum sp. TSO22-1]|uniref:class I SAM-dependent methyltransferase n=1 Tax=Azospirillum sp. TSO22-1 TaxID=716789 RepID=UPI000D61903D|nr:SAM-dependent methyltransferase [Azospirillum sp. TSO22-1]PWC43898.1 ATP synthase subunit beta [Azospirillum sp. TSO22-1]
MTADTLARSLARRIALEGPLTVGAFMAEALGHPRFGYYMKQDPFGGAGDFVTAPEVSQMFGELIGLWCADAWQRLGGPPEIRLIELGPGRGTLMADALRAAAILPPFRAAVRVHLVETSPHLRERQRAALAGAEPTWHDRLDDVPAGPSLVIANEFFDALPVRQVQRTVHGWAERLVDLDPDAPDEDPRFRFVLELGRSPGRNLVPEGLRESPVGSIVEASPAGQSVARLLGARLAAHPGAALVIDYGYGHGPAVGDTLQALRKHAFVPALETPGDADLTAHVDFASLAAAARDGGAEAYGPVTQGELLLHLGIQQRAQVLKRSATPKQAADIDSALDRLVNGEGMGTLFKALALASKGFGPPAGFEG